ncbi:hypothetical protein GZ77_17895 [Endozoicomonas montiporae]|uniref:CN hydrolase domain-containing protein n=2 Tax=Endozoicomonas montiporae TaxID=1027273 RepID=A0A081N1T8_9GAMM|nr:carbon-nitrogen hydrolase family protein [Endozoicomonas montiporae]AMO58647.1 nitrilase [Endozoicomonas montiporae CL-33]KEQ12411.1 hypothetical protein GZ77_17895 [Endozoicomonas montiporae]
MLKAAVVQLCSSDDIDDNLASIDYLLAPLLSQSIDLILLPECFAQLGGDVSAFGKNTTKVRQWMADTARRHQAWLIGGSIPFQLDAAENSRASCFVFNPQGLLESRYDKIHLFDASVADKHRLYRESSDYSAGSQPFVVDMGEAKIGLSICYDLRFPELFRKLVSAGANILTVPSAFTHATGQSHWEVLLRARAIENQCYVLAANQGGLHANKRQTWGHSMIISPWGEVLASANKDPGVLVAELDMKVLYDIRTKMPCLEHRKL